MRRSPSHSVSTSLVGIIFCLAIGGLGTLAAPPALPPQPLARVKLTGIAVLPPDRWAALEVEEYQQPARTLMLAEGERRASVQVVEVDSAGRWVIIRNRGTEVKLTVASAATAAELAADFGGEHRPLPLLPPPDAGDP